MRKLSFETIGSISAIVIGVAALFVAWDEARVLRRQQHAAFMPIVDVRSSLSTHEDSLNISITIANDGVGPALIERAALKIGGVEVQDWQTLRDSILPEPLRFDHITSPEVHTDFGSSLGVLAAGAQARVFHISWPETPARQAAFDEFRRDMFSAGADKIDFTVCYCSVFERCWQTAAQSVMRPEPVDACPADRHDITTLLLQTSMSETEQ